MRNAIRKATEKWGQAEVIQGDGPSERHFDYWVEWNSLCVQFWLDMLAWKGE